MTDQYLYESQFDAQHNFPECTMVTKSLVIASTPRCGSHLLGHTLLSTQKFGFPLEYANPVNVKKWMEIYSETDFDAVLGKLMMSRTSPNGVFSIKTHYAHLDMFGGFQGLVSRLPNPYFVLLSRNDLLAQAISLAIARQSGVWISGQQPKNSKLVYDAAEIEFCLKRTILHNGAWKYLLTSHSVPFIELSFSDVKKDVKSAVQKISELMNVDVDLNELPSTPPTKRQSDTINQEWSERFLKEGANRESFIDIERALGQKSRKRQLVELLLDR